MGQLSRYIDLAVCGYSTASGACEVDCQGAEGVLFMAIPATTVNNTISMELKYGASTTGFVTCASTFTNTSTAAGHYVLVTDVYKPAARWMGATVTSSSTGALPYWTLAFKYGMREQPTTGFSSTDAGMPIATGGVLRCISPTSSTA